jgi:hypothetical protein
MHFKSSSPSKRASSMTIDEFSGDQCLSSAACSSFMADQKSNRRRSFRSPGVDKNSSPSKMRARPVKKNTSSIELETPPPHKFSSAMRKFSPLLIKVSAVIDKKTSTPSFLAATACSRQWENKARQRRP